MTLLRILAASNEIMKRGHLSIVLAASDTQLKAQRFVCYSCSFMHIEARLLCTAVSFGSSYKPSRVYTDQKWTNQMQESTTIHTHPSLTMARM